MIKKFLSCLGCSGIVVVFILGTIAWQSYRFWLQQPAEGAEAVSFEIESGQGLGGIADELKNERLIANKLWFKAYATLAGKARELQAAEYSLVPGMNYADVLNVLVDADSEEIQITIPEGYRLDQIGEVVTQNFDISEDEWESAVGPETPLSEHPFIATSGKPAGADLEGYLFPDTYRFFAEVTAEEIVERMIDEMEENVSEANPQLSVYPGGPETIHEFLTLASIVEREVRGAEEMRTVAGIFYNRLEIGMALQADSTVNYVTGKKTPGISLEDTQLDSPYNTYQHPGLPPGSISNPGLNALKAVANPADTNYFYFLTTPEGEVIYATTHDQHVQNKNQYLR